MPKKPSRGESPKKAAAKKTLADHAEKLAKKLSEPPIPPPVVELPPEPAPEPIIPAEVQLAQQEENKEYAIDIARPETLEPLIRDAWNAVKGYGDAAYDDSAPAFRWDLQQHAISVLTTHTVLRGDSYWAKFENEVAKIKALKVIIQ